MKSKILFIVMCGTIAMTTSIREMAPDLKESQKKETAIVSENVNHSIFNVIKLELKSISEDNLSNILVEIPSVKNEKKSIDHSFKKNDPRHFLLVGRKARDGIVKNDFMI